MLLGPFVNYELNDAFSKVYEFMREFSLSINK